MGGEGGLGFVYSGSFPARPRSAVMLPPLRTTMHLRQPLELVLATAPCTVPFGPGVFKSPQNYHLVLGVLFPLLVFLYGLFLKLISIIHRSLTDIT